MLVVNPDPSLILPLFRALHDYHVVLSPDHYHADGADEDYVAHLAEKVASGGRIFAWKSEQAEQPEQRGGTVQGYLLAVPETRPRDAFRCGGTHMVLDHLFVAKSARGQGVAGKLVAAMEAWMRSEGVAQWVVTYDATNPGVAEIYEQLGAGPAFARNAKRI